MQGYRQFPTKFEILTVLLTELQLSLVSSLCLAFCIMIFSIRFHSAVATIDYHIGGFVEWEYSGMYWCRAIIGSLLVASWLLFCVYVFGEVRVVFSCFGVGGCLFLWISYPFGWLFSL